jgi:hypothetical protein
MFDRLLVLQILRNDQRRHRTESDRAAERAVDRVPHLRGVHQRHDVLARDVLEQVLQIDFLLILAADRRRRRLPRDREHRDVIVLRIVQPVQQMDRSRPRRSEAHARLAGELRVRARHERRLLFVANLDKLDLVFRAIDRGDDPVDPVARVTEDAPHAPCVQAFDKEITDGSHGPMLPNGGGGLSRFAVSRSV